MTGEMIKGVDGPMKKELTCTLVGAGILDYSAVNSIAGRSLIGGEGNSQQRFLRSQFVGPLYSMIPVYFCISGPAVPMERLGATLFAIKQVDHKTGSDNTIRTILGLGSLDEWATVLAYSGRNNYPEVNQLAEDVYQGLKSIGFGPFLLDKFNRTLWHGRPIFTIKR